MSLELPTGILKSNNEIESWLYQSNFYWILECELDNVNLKIKDDILFWKSGTLYWGNWIWGVWENGDFRSGDWKGGIFKSGTFKGNWHLGVWKGESFKGNDLTGKINKLQDKNIK